ncbi:MAG: putative ABC exporter domain-containing protein [Planctomycetaceae bacterium]
MSGPFAPPAPPPSPPPGPTPTPYRAWDGWGLHPALWTLMRLQWRGRWRGTLRQVKTLRGAIYSLLLLGVFGLWLIPSVWVAWQSPRIDPEIPRAIMPPALLVFFCLTLLTSGIESGVHFQPAEVDLLFPGPFRRRQLLLYRIVALVFGMILGSSFFSIIVVRWSSLWPAAYLGVTVALLFLSLLQILLGVLVSVLAEATYTRLRLGVVVVLGLALVLGAWQVWPRGEVFDLLTSLQKLRTTTVGRVVLAPFALLTQVVTAERYFPDLLGWLTAAVGMNLAVIALILKLDANYLEQSVAASQRMQARLQNARRGQALTKARGRMRSPRLPRLGGAGPIAWRQLTVALRNSHFALLFVGLISALMTAPLLFVDKARGGVAAAAPALSMMVFLLPQMLQYDFRGDIERMDVLKSLPISPWGVVFGQLVAPVVLSSLLTYALLVGLWLAGLLPTPYFLAGCVLTPAANLFLFSSENLMFLLFPYSPSSGGVGDVHTIGRNMLLAIGKMAALILGLGIASALGWLAWFVTGQEMLAFTLGTLGALIILCSLLIPLIVLVYDRLDVTKFQVQ